MAHPAWIGRKGGGRWSLSASALEMLLSEVQASLEAYHAGSRLSARVRACFDRLGISPVREKGDERERWSRRTGAQDLPEV